MLKKVVTGVMLALLLTGSLMFAFNVRPVKGAWTGTIYIRADGSIDPPDAPIITSDNVTYTLTDNITSSSHGIVVERNNILLDGAGHEVQGEASGTGILLKENGITVKNLIVSNFELGISNIIERGWICYSSSNNIISGNNIAANNAYGILLHTSSGNTISGNNIMNNDNGIFLLDSSNNSISKNNVTNSRLWGISFVESSNNSIVENHIENNFAGVILEEQLSNNNNISGNLFTNDGLVVFSYGNIVKNNVVNGKPLVYLENASNHVVKEAGQVILINCQYIWVENLNLRNTTIGIELWRTNNTIISGNNLINNLVGLWLEYSSDNIVYENEITNSYYWGISYYYSSNNYFYHNNFISNAEQVHFDSSSLNFWDDGYPSGGNYWSDYKGTDLYSGPYQNETGSDGIGDTPYVIYGDNVDHYPLMNPWGPSINATVDVIPNTLNLRGKLRYVTAYIELPEGYNVSDIDASSILLNNTVLVDLNAPIAIGDYDNDTIPDLMVKFNGTEVMSYILRNINMTKLIGERFLSVILTLTGRLNDGTRFQGSDTIKIIMPMPRRCRALPI